LIDLPSTQRPVPATSLTPASGTTASVDRMTLDVVPGTDPHAQPVTPFGATIPAPTKRGSRGGLFVGALLAVGGTVAFFALRKPPEPKAEVLAQPQVAAAQPSPPVTPPPIATAPLAPDSGLVFEAVHETAAATAKPSHHPGHAWHPPPTTAAVKPPASAKPPVAAAPTQPNRSGGFVPPPVTNPGF
jgi:hypothetical protein